MAIAPLPPLSMLTSGAQAAGSTGTAAASQVLASGQPSGGANLSGANAPSFGHMLNQALEQVNGSQVRADRTAEQFFTGRLQDIHQVTIAMEQARIMMDLAVEVRNKLVEAYQEISRMQV